MRPIRKRRLALVVSVLVGAALATTLALLALNQNLDLFYPPADVVSGKAPVGKRIRAGGMVEMDSVLHGIDGLEVRFRVADMQANSFAVHYQGILPDLFREGQGIIATGELQSNGVFEADLLLAKHDENYMPPELAEIIPH
ncbi:MAG: cytochrome c maturation protein CcmE [Gammaproteobacteria bacterium]|nr:cytochrome c maturation protein CcmE [Gammaproteobacteria bacterium]MCY4278522.1 cytochrome c maturation protein CcmE [Gammaproteobacteria bacterium]